MNRSANNRLSSRLRRLLCALPLAALALPFAARAQDSFVRVADQATGRPVLSVLGTGLGRPFTSLTLDLACPTPAAWTIEVSGERIPPGAPVQFLFGDPRGGWVEVRVVAAEVGPAGRLRLGLDRGSFRAALAQVRGEMPTAPGADAMLLVGREFGLSVGLDALVREMTAFALACEQPSPRRATMRPVSAVQGR